MSNLFDKIEITFIDDDESPCIQIDWDETDPDLQWWNELGEQAQKDFIIKSLTDACSPSAA